MHNLGLKTFLKKFKGKIEIVCTQNLLCQKLESVCQNSVGNRNFLPRLLSNAWRLWSGISLLL